MFANFKFAIIEGLSKNVSNVIDLCYKKKKARGGGQYYPPPSLFWVNQTSVGIGLKLKAIKKLHTNVQMNFQII